MNCGYCYQTGFINKTQLKRHYLSNHINQIKALIQLKDSSGNYKQEERPKPRLIAPKGQIQHKSRVLFTPFQEKTVIRTVIKPPEASNSSDNRKDIWSVKDKLEKWGTTVSCEQPQSSALEPNVEKRFVVKLKSVIKLDHGSVPVLKEKPKKLTKQRKSKTKFYEGDILKCIPTRLGCPWDSNRGKFKIRFTNLSNSR